MDTKKDSSTSDVPTFKVARVGHDRKRKGGGFSFLRGGGTRGVWSGAAGGSGAGAGAGAGSMVAAAGMNFSKFLLIFLVSAGGLGAVGLGRMLGNASNSDVKKPKTFAMASREAVKIEGDISNLPGNTNTIPNSLGYLSGSKDGLTPEERAKKEADAAAAAEAQRVADEEAAKKAEKDNVAGAPAVDPNALLASAQADGGAGAAGAKGGGFGKKFGALSSSMGGGSSLSGGAGLSGGVNRQFGSSGGITKGTGGQMAAMKGSSRPSYSKAGGSKLAASKTKGFARKQLANANAYSRQGAAAAKGESAASSAGTAFDNNPGAGNIISGPGVGKGAGSSSGADSTPNPGSGGGGNGNPTGSQQVDCGADMYQTADGGCAQVPTAAPKDSKPMLTMMANAVMMMLVLVGVISAVCALLGDTVVGTAWAQTILPILQVMGVIIGLLGVAMMAMGDYVTGGIATLLGATIGIFSTSSFTTHTLTPGWGLVAGFGGAAMTMVGKMLDKGNHKDKAPEAAQQ